MTVEIRNKSLNFNDHTCQFKAFLFTRQHTYEYLKSYSAKTYLMSQQPTALELKIDMYKD